MSNMIQLRGGWKQREAVRSAFGITAVTWMGMWWAIRRALKKVNFKASILIWRLCFLIEVGDTISFKITSRHNDDEFYVELTRSERGYYTKAV